MYFLIYFLVRIYVTWPVTWLYLAAFALQQDFATPAITNWFLFSCLSWLYLLAPSSDRLYPVLIQISHHSISFYYRHVMLPKDIAKLVPKTHLMSESEWRNLGVQQSQDGSIIWSMNQVSAMAESNTWEKNQGNRRNDRWGWFVGFLTHQPSRKNRRD